MGIYKKGRMGFTLIELSIVLVIIGLIVGGVLVGRDLIAAAQLRSTIGEMNSYTTAINTFRSKYNAFPGDLTTGQATTLAMLPTSRPGGIAGMVSLQHGNNTIETCLLDSHDHTVLGSEGVLFWRDLSTAGLISGLFTDATDAIITGVDNSGLSLYFPTSKIKTARWAIGSAYNCQGGPYGTYTNYPSNNDYSQTNYFYLGNFEVDSGTGRLSSYILDGDSSPVGGLTPVESYGIDVKIDNGHPATGKVVGNQNNGVSPGPVFPDTGNAWGIQSPANCVELAGYGDGVTDKYNIDSYPDRKVCNLDIRL